MAAWIFSHGFQSVVNECYPTKAPSGRHNKTIFQTYGAWFVGMIIDHGFSATKIEPLCGFIDYGMTLLSLTTD